MGWFDTVITLPASPEELHEGKRLLEEIRALSSLNAILFDHLRTSLLPRGSACALPRNTRIQAGGQAQSDGRVLELYMGILFHCMGLTVLSCGGGPADGGVDLKVQDSDGSIIVVQCKQFSRAVVGYNFGLQLVGAMYTTGASVGVLITPSTASRDVKVLASSVSNIRQGELRLHVWEGDLLERLLGRWSADIIETRAAMLDDVLTDTRLCDRISESQPHGYCIRHAICLSRATGECGKNCGPPGGTKDHEIASSLILPSPSSLTVVPPPLWPHTTDSDEDSGEVLECLSSDEDESVTRTTLQCDGVKLMDTPLPSALPYSSCTPSRAKVTQRSVIVTPGSKSQRSAILWTEEEERELRRCILLVGEGRWTDMLEMSVMLRKTGKTAIKLRDKWKNMRKRQLRNIDG